tara:strand:+ start:547 stop:723 length:177 start_codon:yes stop_codon:yes gene_type:complete
MTITHTHYTTVGATMAPSVADAEGFVAWRANFETLPKATWTRAERWIDAQERRIAQAR